MGPSETLPADLASLRDSGSPEWGFLCGIVEAAYNKSRESDNETTRKYMERLMDLYGIERATE